MNAHLPECKIIRLQDYDYSNEGLYFVTICCQDRIYVFGDIRDGEMIFNEAGRIADCAWKDLPNHNPHIQLDAWCIMPNHVHGIIIINDIISVGTGSQPVRLERSGLEPAPATAYRKHGLPEIIRQFKTFSSRRINQLNGMQGIRLWQRSYYEHIIRNQKSYESIAGYIYGNPSKWLEDEYYME
ncbi:MAG TPA: transposase [Dysgonomonas sp.]|nr:transposase [Dysgonomonas sp.]